MIWPNSLFDNSLEGLWWVLHVKPRAEKALARKCLGRQVSYFLPQCRHQRRGAGRVKDAFLPLFPGYFFLFGGEPDRLMTLETNLVVKVLSVPDQQELFDDLKRINKVIESELAILPEERLRPGMPVAIISRATFHGLDGIW